MDMDDQQNSVVSGSPRDCIIQRLVKRGVPLSQGDEVFSSLVAFSCKNKLLLPELVLAILPSDEDITNIPNQEPKDVFGESLMWIQWLMFQADPHTILKDLSEGFLGQRSVCGLVWGKNDLAYRCRTCELDQTCAICVPCFRNGNHKDHDYSIIYTGGGCCDCGDITAWKREGFCSKHKGLEEIQPLPSELADPIIPVLDVLLSCWKEKLSRVSSDFESGTNRADYTPVNVEITELWTYSIVNMLLDFCQSSESLLCLISRRIHDCAGLLHLLVKGGLYLDELVVRKLHELLLKLLGDPVFKYEFSKIHIEYYPMFIQELVKEGRHSRSVISSSLSLFSVQIFTVPSLTQQLINEVDLFSKLVDCLGKLLHSCCGDDGRLQAKKWYPISSTGLRVVSDLEFILSHGEVSKSVAEEQPHVLKAWMQLLILLQGMDGQKRQTDRHIEEEEQHLGSSFTFTRSIQDVNNLVVEGVFTVDGLDKIGKDAFCSSGMEAAAMDYSSRYETSTHTDKSNCVPIFASEPPDSSSYAGDRTLEKKIWVISECLRAIEKWLETNLPQTYQKDKKCLNLKKRILQFRNIDAYSFRKCFNHLAFNTSGRTAKHKRYEASGRNSHAQGPESGLESENKLLVPEPNCQLRETLGTSDDHVNVDSEIDSDGLGILGSPDWSEIDYDVSTQEVSFHIPLHRFLSSLLHRAMKMYNSSKVLFAEHDFFGYTLGTVHPYGFASFLVEHPLHLRVFCAQVRAGMWKRNGDAGILCCEYYRHVACFEIGIEVDLFLMQCCAALAPPELFVTRILERFRLTHYLSLNLATDNEYEVVLVEEMLVLIIQIIVERRFCGLSATESLQRELVCKLSVEDSTHSQLVSSLPPDLAKNGDLQKVIDMVAAYKKPSGTKQGSYSLKKAYWKLLDIYHPRWDIRHLQLAEERFGNICNVSALDVQLPRWTEIFTPLNSITSIATSKTTGKIIRAVLFYSLYTEMPSTGRSSEEVLVKALHLLSLSLEICEKHRDSKVDILTTTDQMCTGAPNLAEDRFPLLMFATEVVGDSVPEGTLKQDAASEVSVSVRNQSLLSLLVMLMKKRKDERARKPMYLRACNISSLIEKLLKSFAQLSSSCLNELKKLAPDIIFHLERRSLDDRDSLISSSDDRLQKSKARERQAAILERMKSEQSKFMATMESVSMDEVNLPENNQEGSKEHLPVCCLCHDTDSKSPMMILALLQKSRVSSLTDKGPALWQDDYHSQSHSMEDDILHDHSSISSADSDIELPFELHNNPQLDGLEFAARSSSDQIPESSSPNCDTKSSSLSFINALENRIFESIQYDIKEANCHSDKILANEKQFLSPLTEVQKNESSLDSPAGDNVVMHELLKYFSCPMDEIRRSADMSAASASASNPFGPVDCDGMHISSCGHAMHQECYDRYLSSLKRRYQRRLNFEGVRIVDPNMDELLCPVCRRFSNSVLPVISSAFLGSWKERILFEKTIKCSTVNQTSSPRDTEIISNDIPLTSSSLNDNQSYLHLASSVILSSSEVIRRFKLPKTFPEKRNAVLDSALEPIIHKLSAVYSPDEHIEPPSSANLPLKMNDSLMLWDTLRHSIVSTEIASRVGTYEDSDSSFDELFQEFSLPKGHILVILLQAALVTRVMNHIQMLTRFEGIGLFAGAIYSGGLGKGGYPSSTVGQRGSLGIEFKKHASDPILSHDPFSSLIWVLFSLPHPFISSPECFLSLVHLFYVVCVVQALVGCYTKHHFDALDIYGPLHSICKTLSCTDYARNFFRSSSIDKSCNLNESVRKLTFPYLRRSALLWRLLQLCVPAMSCSNSHAIDDFTTVGDSQPSDSAELSGELGGIVKLENMFKIASPELVYRDETVQALALIWGKHFLQRCRASRLEHVLYISPAVPFRLMQLPVLYQDLLQRCIGKPCTFCNLVLEDPTLCLFCGQLLSSPWKRCCRPSSCRTHAASCGSGLGVFLLIKTTLILLQRSARQSLWPSPYLDAYGEEDSKMSRGKPLYLNDDRYMALTKMVVSHSLDHNSEVLRRTTTIFELLD